MHPTDEFLGFLERAGLTFDQASEAHKIASTARNRLEIPDFAKSIENAVLTAA
ncbi:hypothetical protein ACFV9P_00085 [Streptomyces sp. NPDC059892]|uniref:hypothetical protein n=1 Tax=Streptomyces sp. NPDC059892 TaxID=3346989 RepID=UPI003665FF90